MSPHLPWSPPRPPANPGYALITARQAEVLDHLCAGLTNHRIGAEMGVSENTVKTTVTGLLANLGARDRCHAVALACTGQLRIHVKGWT